MRRSLDFLYFATGVLAGISLVVAFLLMLAVSAGRIINVNVSSADDFVGFSVVAMGSLGLAYTFKAGEIIRMGLLIDTLSVSKRRLFEMISLAAATLIVGYFAWYVFHMAYDSWRFGAMSSGVVALPLWPPQLVFGFGMLVFFISILDELVRVRAGHAPAYDKTPELVDGVPVHGDGI